MSTFREYLIESQKSRQYEPRIIKGIRPDTFAEYQYSANEILGNIKSLLNESKITIKNIARLFSEYNLLIDERVVIDLPIMDVNKYREYDRDLIDGFTGKNNTAEMRDLIKDIKSKGIKEAGVIDFDRLPNSDVGVILGEGNHRLNIAKSLKIKSMPIRFYYKK